MAGKRGRKVNNTNKIVLIDDLRPETWVQDNKKIINSIIDKKIEIKAKNKSQEELIKNILSKEIVICSGRAGTGKTFISLAMALGLLKSLKNNFVKIYLVKSVTTLKGEEIGYLKGDLNDKIEPFIWSFVLNVEKLIPDKLIRSIIDSDFIRPFPIAYARGTSIDNAIIIVDECFSGESKIIINDNEFKKPKEIKFKNLLFYFKKYKNLKVLSYNHDKKINEYNLINSIRITKNKKTIKIKFNGVNRLTEVTENHPFAVLNNGIISYNPIKEINIGDRIIKRKYKKGNHSVLNDKNYDILLGFLLGDGSMIKNKQWGDNIFRIKKQHSLKQNEYNKFCASLYNAEVSDNGKSGFTEKKMSVFQTKSFFINDFYKSIYNDKYKKRITHDIKKYITIRTLATWFMDDGNNNIYSDEGSNITLHSEGFTKNDNYILCKILKNKFHLDGSVEVTKKPRKDREGEFNYYYYLRFNNENSNKLQNLIKEYIHPSMYYKLNNKYKNKFIIQNYLVYKNFYELTTSVIVDKFLSEEEKTVYNLEVANNNNYYADNMLAHNCQNISKDNMHTLMTRIGENSKMILLGDTRQVDLRNKQESSLKSLISMFKDVDQIGVVEMDDTDGNVRNPIIDIIEKKFDELEDGKH